MEKKKVLLFVLIVLALVLFMLTGLFIYEKVFDKDAYVSSNTRVLDLAKVEEYKNYDGTYAVMESVVFGNSVIDKKYTINLGMDGRVFNGNYGDRKYIGNLTNVIDIMIFNNVSYGVRKCYILTDSGELYFYDVSNIDHNVYEVTKVEDVSSVDRLIEFNYGPSENASTARGIIAITKDGKYVEIDRTGA